MSGHPSGDVNLSAREHGALLTSQFELQTQLRSGGHSTTWMAGDPSSHGHLVVRTLGKEIVPQHVRDRLAHDAAVVQEAQPAGVVRILSCQRMGPLFVIVRRYVSGRTLGEWLQEGSLSVPEAISLITRLAELLEGLHRQKIIHRALKPSNVVVDGKTLRDVVLVDFGLSSVDVAASLKHVDIDAVRFMSPEQAGLLERPVGPTTDLYALGVILFRAITGKPAFPGESLSELLRQHLAPRPKLGVSVPRALEDVLERLLSPAPDDRYQTAKALLADLHEIDHALRQGIAEPMLRLGARDVRHNLTEPAFIGRHAELASLERELAYVCEGSSRLVGIEAESGGGKTRFLDEFARRIRDPRIWVLRGHGVDQDAVHPFQIFSDISFSLRSQQDVTQLEKLRKRLGQAAPAVCAVLPALSEALQCAREPQRQGTEANTSHRAVWALSSLLAALGSSDRPAVVLLDDCQWAADLLGQVLEAWRTDQTERPGHLLIVVAFRSDDADARETLRRLTSHLHVRLPPLGQGELEALAESMAGALPKDVLAMIHRVSEGNPFMASAVLHGLVDEGYLVPLTDGWTFSVSALEGVSSSHQAAMFLLRRLRLLPKATLRLVSLGAILGKRFSLRRLATLAQTTPTAAANDLSAARERHLLWTDNEGEDYAIVHDKIRDALLSLFSGEERQRLHLLAARTYGESPDDHAFELAYHYDAAGAHEDALPHALRAADASRARNALDTAEKYYRIAERSSANASARHRYQIREGLGEVLMLRGQYAQASEQFESALSLTDSPETRALTLGKIGELAFKRGDFESAVSTLENALRLLQQRLPASGMFLVLALLKEVSTQTAHSLFPQWFVGAHASKLNERSLLEVRLFGRLGYAYWFRRGRIATLWAHLRHMNVAEQYGPSTELAQAYSNHAPAMTMIPWFRRALSYAEKSLSLRVALGDVWGQGQSLHFQALALYSSSRFRETIGRCEEAERLLERTGDPWEMNNARSHIAMARYRLGELHESAKVSRKLYDAAQALGDRYSARLALEFWSKATGGRVPDVLTRQALQEEPGDLQSYTGLLQAEAIRLLRAGAPDEAVRLLEKAENLLSHSTLKNEYVMPVTAWLATALRACIGTSSPFDLQKRKQLLHRASVTAERAYRRALKYRNNLPHALRERALIAAMKGRTQSARRGLNQSLVVARQLGMRQEEALTLQARGEVGKALRWPSAQEDEETAQRALRAMDACTEGEGDPDARNHENLSLVDRFPRVLNAGRKIASALTPDGVFEAVSVVARELLRTETVSVVNLAQAHQPGTMASCGISWDTLLAASAAGHPAVFDASSIAQEGLPGSRVRSVLCAPIFLRGKPVSCLCASHSTASGLFGEDEIRLAEFIIALAGVALENAENLTQMTALSEERGRLYREEQEAVKRRDDFLSIAAHELKTPLTPLTLYLQGLLSRLREGVALNKTQLITKLESANHQTQRLGRLVNELLDISRVATGHLQVVRAPTDLVPLVQNVVDRFREMLNRASCELSLRHPESLVGFWDALRLEQVVSNLIANALKYGAGHPVEIALVQDHGFAEIIVKDHGIGIALEDQNRIFERFERAVPVTNYGGFGLGLWIVREIVQAMHGTVSVESVMGQGASFRVTLPLSPPTEARGRG